MFLKNIFIIFLLSVFAVTGLSCGGSSGSDDADDDTTTTTETFPEELNLNLSDNLISGTQEAEAELLFMVGMKNAAIGETTEYINEISTAFATTFGDQGPASIERVEDLAEIFNSVEFATGNNCVSDGETSYYCVIAEDATFDSTSYDKVARCYQDSARYLEWYFSNDGSTTNNGVLVSNMILEESHGGPEGVGDLYRARIDYNLDDVNAKSVVHVEATSRDDDTTLVSTMITMGVEDESTGMVNLEAIFFGDFSGDGTAETNHDLAINNTATGYTNIQGIAYNNHSELPGDSDDAECIDTTNTVVDSSNCTGQEVDLTDVTIDAAYEQFTTLVNGVSLEFSSDFEETIPADLASTTCTEVSVDGGSGDGPSAEEVTACTEASGVTVDQTLEDVGEEAFIEFCVCLGETEGFGEAECTEAYDSCDATDTLQACLESQGS